MKEKNDVRRWIIYAVSLLCILGFRFIPPVPGISASGMQVLGVFIGTLILWLTVAIDWPSILCLAGLTFVPEMSMNSILASSFGNSTFAFLLCTFMCTYALSKTSFVKRCAIAFICNRLARKGSWWFVTLYCLSVLVLGQLFCCCFSCGMTPIAHVFPVMAIGFYQTATDTVVSYASYMGFAVPVGLIVFLVMILMFRFFLRPDMSKFQNLNLDSLC